MKQSLRVLSAAAAIALLPALAVAGGPEHKAQRAECRVARDAKHLPAYDKNRDGAIDRTERQAIRQDRRQQALAKFDADRDGQLNETERAKLWQSRVVEKFATLDVNRDGAITRDEVSGPCSRLAKRFDAVDQDKNGRIVQAELAAARIFGKGGKFRRHHQAESDDVPDEAVQE